MNLITAVLCEWQRPEALRAVALALHATITRLDAADVEARFVQHQALPSGLGLAGGPHAARVTEEAGDAVWRTVPELLERAADALWPPDSSEAEAAAAAASRTVRLLFLLLLHFDGRVRRLVLKRDNPCLRAWQLAAAPERKVRERFLDAAAAKQLVNDLVLMGSSSAAASSNYDAVVAAYVEQQTRRWRYGVNTLPAVFMERESSVQ
jgi:hypothetical protein